LYLFQVNFAYSENDIKHFYANKFTDFIDGRWQVLECERYCDTYI
jgi:hypothetical protein